MNKKKLLILIGTIITIAIVVIIVMLINNKKETTYNITFETNGGSLVESQIVNEGDQVKKPVDPIKEGYMFVEWTYQSKTYDFSLEVTSDLNLTARWEKLEEDVEKFIIKFDVDGGTTISNQIVEKGNKLEKPIDPTKDGYVFKGWTLDGETYDFETIVEKNIELKANWEKMQETSPQPATPTVKKYTVTFNSKGGSSVSSQTVTEGSKVSKPSDPTKSGYTFAGWTLNGSAYDFNSVVKSNFTLVAKWNEVVKNNYTVTFNSNGGSSVSSQTVTEGSKVSKPSDPTKSGYTFAGWTLNGSAYDFNSVVKSNFTLVAKWNEVVKNNYTVTFDSKGGSAIGSKTVAEGNKVQKPSDPTKEGYRFTGWTLNGNTYDFNMSVTSNITLVANWIQKNYTVTATAADQTSPFSRVLTVYEEGTKITVKTIQYSDGTTLCQGANPNVNYYAIEGEQNLKLVLNGGTIVTASLTIN